MNASKQLEDAVFFAALHLTDSEQRRAFLDQACAGNPAMRTVVEELLAAQEATERLLNRGRSALESALRISPLSAATALAAANPPADERVGTRIGPYKLLQRIGEGGCGVVYLAEQEHPCAGGGAQSHQAGHGHETASSPASKPNGRRWR